MDRDTIQKIEEIKQKTSESPGHYLDLLSALNRDEPIKGLSNEETEILRRAYGGTRDDKQNS